MLSAEKRETPTLGGLLLLAAFVAGCAVAIPILSPVFGVILFLVLGFGGLGFIDDLIKLTTDRRGLSARVKLFSQIVLSLAAALLIYHYQKHSVEGLNRTWPLLGVVSLHIWSVPLAACLLVLFSNAVNLTDGLDGLAAGCDAWLLLALITIGICCDSTDDPLLAGGALLGSVTGFLWFNRHPAQVFMGNTGSSAVGALTAALAILLRQEWVLVVAGCVFTAEALSVVVQVGYFKCSGRRILRCAPLHHHFQFAGWQEVRIVRRFWLAAATCALVAICAASWGSLDQAKVP